MVKIIAESQGFGTLEINASDKRSKAVIEAMLSDLCSSTTMDYFFKKDVETRRKEQSEKRK